jgi:phosphinothricin acetyltransferase
VDAESFPLTMTAILRELTPEDWPAVRAFCEDGIRDGDPTFETETPSWEAWDAACPGLRLVAEQDGPVVGRRSRPRRVAGATAASAR